MAAVRKAKCFLTTNFLLRVLTFVAVLSREAEGGWSSQKPKKSGRGAQLCEILEILWAEE